MKYIKWLFLIVIVVCVTLVSVVIKNRMHPLVSVVMPVYNREKLVSRAIESILNQTYKHFEFIIVDDGSTDATPQILQSYAQKDKRIRILSNQQNRGISYSRQKGLDAAKGKYVAIMDSDDYSVPRRLEKSVAFMEDYPDVTAMSGNTVDFVGDQLPTLVPGEDIRQLYRVQHDVGFYEVELLLNNVFPNTVSLFRRDFVKEHNIHYDLYFQSAEDYDFWIQIIFAGGRFASLSDILGYVRRHTTNSKSYYDDMVSNSIRIHKKAFELFFTPKEEELKFAYNQLEFCSILEKMKNSDRPRDIIPKEMIERRHALWRCPKTTQNALFLKHALWRDFLIPIGGKKYRRYSSDDTATVEFKKNYVIIHWDHWNPEKFIKNGKNSFEFQKAL